jgi:hypothetical protein
VVVVVVVVVMPAALAPSSNLHPAMGGVAAL